MSIRKGSRYITCPECKRKRYCISKPLPNYWKQWTCSKGHIWKIEYGNHEKIIAIEMERIIPKLKNLFEMDDMFYRNLKR